MVVPTTWINLCTYSEIPVAIEGPLEYFNDGERIVGMNSLLVSFDALLRFETNALDALRLILLFCEAPVLPSTRA